MGFPSAVTSRVCIMRKSIKAHTMDTGARLFGIEKSGAKSNVVGETISGLWLVLY